MYVLYKITTPNFGPLSLPPPFFPAGSLEEEEVACNSVLSGSSSDSAMTAATAATSGVLAGVSADAATERGMQHQMDISEEDMDDSDAEEMMEVLRDSYVT